MPNRSYLHAVSFLTLAVLSTTTVCFGQDIELVVAEGNNLISICEAYLDDPGEWPQVAAANHLIDPDLIFPGQRIVIPAKFLKGVPISGVATFVKGTVEIQQKEDAGWRPLSLNDPVAEGSRLKTGGDSALEVTFDDGSTFYMKPDTTVGLQKSRVRGMVYILRELILEAGRVITRIQKSTGRESRFEVITPAATAGARGTEFRAASDPDAVTRVEVLDGVVDARAARRTVVLNKGEGTVVKKGRPPAPPIILLKPPDAIDPRALYQRLPLEFRFGRVPGAAAYRVLLAVDVAFMNLIAEDVISPSEPARIDGVDDGLYYMQVRSIDEAGLEGLPSRTVPVRVRVNPVPPFVSAPVDGKTYRATSVSFNWLNVPDAAAYALQIAADPDFKTIVHRREKLRETSYEVKDLPFSTYYFRVRSVAADGFKGIWSDATAFILSPPPPAPPTEPPEVGEKQITIRWQNQGPGMRYHFQMAGDKDFTRLLMDEKLSTPDTSFDKPTSYGTYYIRVSGIDADGFEGRFSPAQTFDVKRDPKELWDVALAVGTILLILIP